jgi:hypothetical protein
MKLLSIFTVAATFVVGTLAAVPQPHLHALTVRGGASLGPLDAKLALDLSKAATTAYAAGTASKYINKQIGGKDTQVSTLCLSIGCWSLVVVYMFLLLAVYKRQLT